MSRRKGSRAAWSDPLDRLVEAALREDVGDGDRTTLWSVPAGARGEAQILTREAGVVSGVEVADRVFARAPGDLTRAWSVEEGDPVEPGAVLVRLRGALAPILTAERTALNFLGRLSGIATLTARHVEAVRDTGCRITDTRKTTPGWRVLEKAATAAGGARNHRMGLYDMVLLKENHLRAAGGIRRALRAVLPRARAEGLEVEVEVTTLAELEEALAEAPDRILLDNMEPEELRRAVERTAREGPERPLLEASGGVTLVSVRRVAETGVDLISVGALTHSAPPLELTLQVEET